MIYLGGLLQGSVERNWNVTRYPQVGQLKQVNFKINWYLCVFRLRGIVRLVIKCLVWANLGCSSWGTLRDLIPVYYREAPILPPSSWETTCAAEFTPSILWLPAFDSFKFIRSSLWNFSKQLTMEERHWLKKKQTRRNS